jgi:hypothetical protein
MIIEYRKRKESIKLSELCQTVQSYKKKINVQDPNFGQKKSGLHISVNMSKNELCFFI